LSYYDNRIFISDRRGKRGGETNRRTRSGER
jgi:hypothetical protein